MIPDRDGSLKVDAGRIERVVSLSFDVVDGRPSGTMSAYAGLPSR